MRIVVVGAGGGTGRLVVEHGVRRGHSIVAVSRRGSGVTGARDVRGDATDPDVINRALADGADAMVLAIGGTSGTDTNRTDVTRTVLTRLTDLQPRVIVQSSLGVGESARFLPAPARLLIATVLRKAIADHTSQEELVRSSGLPWTIVRPGGLTDKPATGRIVALEQRGPMGGTIPRADVAAFLLDCLDDPTTVGHAYALGTAG